MPETARLTLAVLALDGGETTTLPAIAAGAGCEGAGERLVNEWVNKRICAEEGNVV